ncbi:hypothetical protein QBC39DRAFT_338211 [Podospora conica]|nr:hypothetical protein QBC39DRAFT_338211 [Schizothecium conicum]
MPGMTGGGGLLILVMVLLMQVSGELRGELRSYPAKDALSIRCVLEGGICHLHSSFRDITPPSKETLPRLGCHTQASLASELDRGLYGDPATLRETLWSSSWPPLHTRFKLKGSKHHHMVPRLVHAHGMGIEDVL